MNRLLTVWTLSCAVIGLVVSPADALPPSVSNVFDRSSGAIISSSFGGPKWESSFFGLTANSGSKFFESDNGNFNHDFVGEHLAKRLGGVIEDSSYDVSFYIAANNLGGQNMSAVEFSDFSSLAIGGAGGTMNWIATPTPIPDGGWVEWSGRYTPSASDIGQPFQFRMVVDIDSRHSLAIDGLMTAVAVIPEPGCFLLVGMASVGAWLFRRRRV